MKQFIELIPIALFFIVYQMNGYQFDFAGWQYTFDGIYTATAVLMAATTLQMLLAWYTEGKLEKRQLGLLAAVCIFGGLTLILRNQLFIQWKPTIFNWGLALVFLGSQFIGKKSLMERTLGSQIQVESHIWNRVSWLWIANFSIVGTLNLYVAYNFSESAWVSYKLYSSIGFTLVLSIATVALLAPHMKDIEKDETSKE
ncbi:MAG: inner membrane-spanning protein YciB [Pseudomonadales bacterium]